MKQNGFNASSVDNIFNKHKDNPIAKAALGFVGYTPESLREEALKIAGTPDNVNNTQNTSSVSSRYPTV